MSDAVSAGSTEPVTEILGGPELFIDTESTINLTCVVRRSPEPPAFIFWKHNDQVRLVRLRPDCSYTANKGQRGSDQVRLQLYGHVDQQTGRAVLAGCHAEARCIHITHAGVGI